MSKFDDNFTTLNPQQKLLIVFNKITNGEWKTRRDIAEGLYFEEFRNLQGEEYEKKLENKKKTVSNIIKRINQNWNTVIHYDDIKHSFVIKDQGDLKQIGPNGRLSLEETHLILSIMQQSAFLMPNELRTIKLNLINLIDKEEDRHTLGNYFLSESTLIDKIVLSRRSEIVEVYEDNFKMIRDAILANKKVKFTAQQNEKIVTPIWFDCVYGQYILIAIENKNKKFMRIRVSSMEEISILEDGGEKELATKDRLEEYINQIWYGQDGDETKIVIKIKKDSITENLINNTRYIKEKKVIFSDDDTEIIEFFVKGIDGIKVWILGFGNNIEVVEPLKLRQAVRSAAENMIKLYRK